MGYQDIMREYAKKLESYSGKSVDELLAITNGNEIDFIQAIEMAIQQKLERLGEDNLSEEEVIVLAVEALEREVNNGGYSQFFVNSSREYTPIIVHALGRIGCTETAKITERAVKAAGFSGLAPLTLKDALDAFSKEYERQNEYRLVTPAQASEIVKTITSNASLTEPFAVRPNSLSTPEWDVLEEELNECDQLYYAAGVENIGGKLIDFVKANKDAIQP
jgi:hypothetical protein